MINQQRKPLEIYWENDSKIFTYFYFVMSLHSFCMKYMGWFWNIFKTVECKFQLSVKMKKWEFSSRIDKQDNGSF